MVKMILKLSLCTGAYALVFAAANAFMPFSDEFKELVFSEPGNPLLLPVISALVCFTIFFMVRHANYTGIKLFLNMVFVLFFVQLFMAQIETLFFGHAFSALTTLDVILIMLAGLLPLLGVIPIMIKFFQNKNAAVNKAEIDVKSILPKLGIIGIIYAGIYMVFGYFVAWQFEELRIFYSGSPEKLSLLGQLANNMKTNPVIYPFQLLRGIMFGIFVVPLINMFNAKKIFIASICLVYSYLGYIFILPNALFPNMVRLGHFLEMISSMLLFGIIVGNILWRVKENKGILNKRIAY